MLHLTYSTPVLFASRNINTDNMKLPADRANAEWRAYGKLLKIHLLNALFHQWFSTLGLVFNQDNNRKFMYTIT